MKEHDEYDIQEGGVNVVEVSTQHQNRVGR